MNCRVFTPRETEGLMRSGADAAPHALSQEFGHA